MISLSRRALSGGAAAVLVAGTLVACSDDDEPAEASGSPDQVTYLTAFGEFGREGYVHVADAKGFFADENIEITIQPGDPGNAEVVSAGQADFASTDSSGALQRFEAGLDFRIVSAVQQLPLMALITVESTGITQPADLEGTTIGCAENSIIGHLFPAYAAAQGFDPDAATIEPVDAAQIPASLASAQVDAVCLFAVGQPAIEAAAEEPAVVLPYNEVLGDLYGAVHITSPELAEEDPDLVRRFNAAILRGLEYAIENPAEAGEILTEYVPETNPEVAAAELSIMAEYVRAGLGDEEPTGMMSGSKATEAAGLLEEAGLLETGSAELIDQVVAWELVPGAEDHDLEQR